MRKKERSSGWKTHLQAWFGNMRVGTPERNLDDNSTCLAGWKACGTEADRLQVRSEGNATAFHPEVAGREAEVGLKAKSWWQKCVFGGVESLRN